MITMITKKPYLVFVLITVLLNQSNAQVIYDWTSFLSGGTVYERFISYSDDGSVYAIGSFEGTISNNDLSITADLGGYDVYLTKMNSEGEVVWLKRVGSGTYDGGRDAATDSEGNVYFVVDTQGGPLTLPNGLVLSNSQGGIFILKFDTNGTFVWHQTIPALQQIEVTNSSIYVTQFGGQILRLSTENGSQLASYALSSANALKVIATNDGRIAVTAGIYSESTFPDGTTFYNSGMGIAINQFGQNEIDYGIVCLDTALNYLWAHQLCSSHSEATITSDDEGNIYATVGISYEATFDGVTVPSPESGIYTKVILRYAPDGIASWTQTFNQTQSTGPRAIIGTQNGVIVIGENYGIATLSDGSVINSPGSQDAMIVGYNSDATTAFVDLIGRYSYQTTIFSVDKDNNGNYYAGGYNNSTNFFVGCNFFENQSAPAFFLRFHPGDRSVATPAIVNNGGTLTATPEFNGTINWYLEGNTTPVATGAVFNPTQIGFYYVTYTNEFNCSAASATILIQELDTTAPEISCTTSADVMAGDLCTGLAQLEISATDNSGVPTITNSFNDQGGSVLAEFPIGSTTIVFTATDFFGNASTCEVAVNVMDGDAPTITCPANVNAETLTTDIELTIGQALAADNCSDVEVSNSFNMTSDATGLFPIGTTVVTYTALDAAGNSSTCDVEVIVTAISPVIEQAGTIAELWPNPAQNHVTLRLNKSWFGQLSILNSEGRIVTSWNNIQTQNQLILLSVSDLPSGFYVLEGYGSETIRTRFIVE